MDKEDFSLTPLFRLLVSLEDHVTELEALCEVATPEASQPLPDRVASLAFVAQLILRLMRSDLDSARALEGARS